MKYCGKCGNEMLDEMLFCQKCGTKFDMSSVQEELSELEKKVKKLKKYNLILDSKSISWEYVDEDHKRAMDILNQQAKMATEAEELIKEILSELSEVDDNNRDLIEREVYKYVLTTGIQACEESAKMFSDYSGYKETFEKGKKALYETGRMSADEFLAAAHKLDFVYKGLSGMQTVNACTLKELLNPEVIWNSLEYKDLTLQFAKAYIKYCLAEFYRGKTFFYTIGIKMVDMNWDTYVKITKGLPLTMIETIDEQFWDIAVEAEDEKEKGYKQKFLERKEEQREELKKLEKEWEEKIFWESHPEKYLIFQEKVEKIKKIEEKIAVVDSDILSLDELLNPLRDSLKSVQEETVDNNKKIEKLQKKIFGKKRAAEEIIGLQEKNKALADETVNLETELNEKRKPIIKKEAEKEDLQKQIVEIQKEIEKIKN